MEISIVREGSNNPPVLYVACTTKERALAAELHDLFNEKVGGFEFCEPYMSNGSWTTRTLCHLQLKSSGATGRRGNTVVHAFMRVLNLTSSMKGALLRRPAQEVAEAAESLGTSAPHLFGLAALLIRIEQLEDLGSKRVFDMCQEMDIELLDLPEDHEESLATGAYVGIYTAMCEDLDAAPKWLLKESGGKTKGPPEKGSVIPYVIGAFLLGLTLATIPGARRLFGSRV